MIPKKRPDLRVRLTHKMIRQAFTEMLMQRPIQNITVSEICEKCEINRSTFYSHYTDIYDLLEKLENEIYEEFMGALSNVDYSDKRPEDQIPSFLVTMFEFIKANTDICSVLLAGNTDRRFVRKLFNLARERSIIEYSKVYNKASVDQIDTYYTFIASGCLGLLESWIKSDFKTSSESLAESAYSIMTRGIGFIRNPRAF